MLRTAITVLSLLFTLLAFDVSFASDDECSEWTNTYNGCIFGDYNNSWRWERDCSNSSNQCRAPRHNRNQRCDSEDICLPTQLDPNTDMPGICTNWERHDGVECGDSDGNLVQKWIRACTQVGIATSACSRTRPRNFDND